MLEVSCMTCRKKYNIDHRDPQYQKIKKKLTKFYVCKRCNSGMQKDAVQTTGINPNDIDEHDQYLN
jgi:uncharacterized protein YlaI